MRFCDTHLMAIWKEMFKISKVSLTITYSTSHPHLPGPPWVKRYIIPLLSKGNRLPHTMVNLLSIMEALILTLSSLQWAAMASMQITMTDEEIPSLYYVIKINLFELTVCIKPTGRLTGWGQWYHMASWNFVYMGSSNSLLPGAPFTNMV